MKKLKILFAFALILLLGACDVEYYDNPNEPVDVPTSALFNNNTKRLVDAMQDGWWSGRFTYVYMQYWHQTEYGDEVALQHADQAKMGEGVGCRNLADQPGNSSESRRGNTPEKGLNRYRFQVVPASPEHVTGNRQNEESVTVKVGRLPSPYQRCRGP